MALSARYRVLSELGRGGMGTVLLVYDEERGEPVALKRMLGRGPAFDMRLKREYRVLQELRHPNLVRLHELAEDTGGLYFTMEAIRGVDLFTAYRQCILPVENETGAVSELDPVDTQTLSTHDGPAAAGGGEATRGTGPWVDIERLGALVAQLIAALAYLHAREIVHRDLTRHNVLVTDTGIVKLLDFGIIAEARDRAIPQRDLDAGRVVGTPGYMAPELRIYGAPVTTAADIYALGVLIFLLVAGRMPRATFERVAPGTPSRVEGLASVAPEASGELDWIVARMMAPDPKARPSLMELARVLRIDTKRGAIGHVGVRRVLAGRDDLRSFLMTQVDAVRAGAFRAVVLAGLAGAGKTALAESAAEHAAAHGALVLRGRARQGEAVPFNALDGAIDELALALRSLPGDTAFRTSRAIASVAFPVLRTPNSGTGREASGLERGPLFSAVVTLLARAAATGRGLVLMVDDLQWADSDSLSLLRTIVEEAPAHVAVLGTVRDDLDADATHLATALSAWRRVDVPPLDDGALIAIAHHVATAAGAQVSTTAIAPLVGIAAGRPFLAELLGRFVATHADDTTFDPQAVLLDTARALSPLARRVIALLLAEDGWLTMGELAPLAGASIGGVDTALDELGRHGLVRLSGLPGRQLRATVYHDVIASVFRTALAVELHTAHVALAEAIEAGAERSAHRIVRHVTAIGQSSRALSHARVAARTALDQRAYGLAADMLAVMLEHASSAERHTLLAQRGEALTRSSRYDEAAVTFAALARESAGEAASEAALSEAHAHLAAGKVRDGRDALERALAAADFRAPRHVVLIGLALARYLRGPTPVRIVRPSPAPSPAAFRRSELDVRLANMLSFFDPRGALYLLRRAHGRAVAAGLHDFAACVDYLFGYIATFTCATRAPSALSERYRHAADTRVLETGSPYPLARAWRPFLRAIQLQHAGRFNEGRLLVDDGLAVLEEAGLAGTFDHLFGFVHRAQLDWYAQDLRGLGATLARLRSAVRTAGTTAMHCHLAFLQSLSAAYSGDTSAARGWRAQLAETLPRDEWTFQRTLFAVWHPLSVMIDDPIRLRIEVARAIRAGRAHRPLATMYAGSIAGGLALVEALALRCGDTNASPRRVHHWAARCRRTPPLAATCGIRAQAYAEDAAGRPAHALALLAEAETEAARWNQHIDVAIARFQRGLRTGGDEGRLLQSTARTLIGESGASDNLLNEDFGWR